MLEIFCVFHVSHIQQLYRIVPRSSSIVYKGEKKYFFASPPPYTKHKTRTHLYKTQLYIRTYISVFRFAPLSHQSRSITTEKKAQNSIPSIPSSSSSSSSAIHPTTQSHHPHSYQCIRFQYKMLAVLPVPIINDSHKQKMV